MTPETQKFAISFMIKAQIVSSPGKGVISLAPEIVKILELPNKKD